MTVSRRAALALAGLPLTAPALRAQGNAQGAAQVADWPTGQVRFIGLFPPGGGTDILSRIWCHCMAELTGQQFIVENRAGAAGNIGTEAIARSAPDGRTIGLASVAPLAIAPSLYNRIPFDPARDFTFLGGIWLLPNLLIVNNDVPARTVPELIALCRANPGKYIFASSGSGTTVHLSGELFKTMAGIDILHVPYRGGAPAHLDLYAGRVHMIFDNIPQGLAAHRDGKVRALGVTGPTRSPDAAEIPAMNEFLPGFEITSWAGVMGPAGMPPPMVERIAALSKQAVDSPELRQRFRENAAVPWPVGPVEFAQFRAAEERAFAPLIRASGAKVE